MNPMRDLPMGFGMALMQNEAALHRFEAMTPAQQEQILAKTHAVSSKSEMQALVSSIAT
ncbi:MAG: hypothetical protein KHW93_00420 [Butyricicoccus pullicaecorum]|nr:hypothetical protein [Butyricicoccus pullicaecorum]